MNMLKHRLMHHTNKTEGIAIVLNNGLCLVLIILMGCCLVCCVRRKKVCRVVCGRFLSSICVDGFSGESRAWSLLSRT